MLITSASDTIQSQDELNLSEEEINELINAIYDEISTYISIDQILGRYNQSNENRYLNQLTIQIHSTFPKDIIISDIVVEVSDGKQIQFFSFNNKCDLIYNQSLFSNNVWKDLKANEFGILTIFDKDKSIVEQQIINHHSDRVILIFKLDEFFEIKNGDIITISLHPSFGTIRTLRIEIPFSTKQIVQII
jgi:archaellin